VESSSPLPSLEAMLQILAGLAAFAESTFHNGGAETAEFRRGLAICEQALKTMAQRA
jgi:hypothetical protein